MEPKPTSVTVPHEHFYLAPEGVTTYYESPDEQTTLTTETLTGQQGLEYFESLAETDPSVAEFEAAAVEPTSPYIFPEPPEVITDAESQMGPVLNWRLNQAACHLDRVRELITDEAGAREWLGLKLEASAGRTAGFSDDKLDMVIAFEKQVDAYLRGIGGGTVYADP